MAVPTAAARGSGATSRFVIWLRKLGNSFGRPLFAILLAVIAGSIVMFVTTPGAFSDKFTTVITAYQDLYNGSFGNWQAIAATLTRVGPLVLTGLSVSIAFRAGLFNIGAEGQLAMGAMVAGVLAYTLPGLPGWILIPLMIIASATVGAIWGGIVGILKAWRGAHEVVTTIMLNWIAFYFTDYLILGPFKDPKQADVTPILPPNATLPTIAVFYNQTLGTFLPKIADPAAYLVDVSFFFCLIALVVYWFITRRTTFGYEVRVIGQNPKAARYAGIPIKRNIFLVMALAGAFSGLAGAFHFMGQSPQHLIAAQFSIDSTGFDAIGVSLLGRTTSIGVFLASLLFGALRQGGTLMQLDANVPADLVYIVQAIVLFSIAAEFLPVIQRNLPRWMLLRRPALATNVIGSSNAEAPLVENLPDDSTNGMNGIDSDTKAQRGNIAVIERTEHGEDNTSMNNNRQREADILPDVPHKEGE